MVNKDIWKIAMEQSAVDFNCSVDAFLNEGNTVVLSRLNEGRKKCYKKPMFCSMAFYGGGLIASVDERINDFIEGFVGRHPGYRCFDTPQLIVLNRELERYGKCVCHIAEFFLPDLKKQVTINDSIEVKIFSEEEIPSLYKDDRFHMALGYSSKGDKKDVLAAVGYIDGKIAGVAGASNDCDTMWQIGIDVLPEYRRMGVASTLTKFLTDEIIRYGKVPYYCTAWSNIASKNNATKCGYKTAWVEMAAVDTADAMKMIGEQAR
ncbi:MAG: GNAT family N-acetyltransferase [Bacillota bacterium]|nr:GNAT family N-acetyltransferase [Bacillota bacterium]